MFHIIGNAGFISSTVCFKPWFGVDGIGMLDLGLIRVGHAVLN